MFRFKKSSKGFSVPEGLIVIGVIGVITFIAIRNPSTGIKSWFQPSAKRDVSSEAEKPQKKGVLIPKDIKNLPKYDLKNPQSNGIFVFFKQFPLMKKQRDILLQKAEEEGFKTKERVKEIKAWMFFWDKWYPAVKAKTACDNFKKIPFVTDCDINEILKLHSNTQKSILVADNSASIRREGGGSNTTNFRNCGVISEELDLKGGGLSDYWAQRMIGADLSKELLLFTLPVKDHLIAVFDAPPINYSFGSMSHGAAVRSLISDKGKQAVMPNLGEHITFYGTPTIKHLVDSYKSIETNGNNHCYWEKGEDYKGLCPPGFYIDYSSNSFMRKMELGLDISVDSESESDVRQCCRDYPNPMCMDLQCPTGKSYHKVGIGQCI